MVPLTPAVCGRLRSWSGAIASPELSRAFTGVHHIILAEGGVALSTLYSRLRDQFHEARADLFVRLLRPHRGQRLLDLGGGDGSLAERIVDRVELDVTVADVAETLVSAKRRGFNVKEVEAGEPLPFANGAFDIVLCNSVLEHATSWHGSSVGGGWSVRASVAQSAFAAEIRRVAHSYFVQTPHADFPIDAHLWLPFTNWVPRAALVPLVSLTDKWWIKKCGVADWKLLRRRSLQALFPEGSVYVERLMGLPKSLVVYRQLHAPGYG